ncbi:helix-turn-helix domain-containing protein [Treponema berlinense]|uniref:helix-turn-helix domain-containing protein n=1 Tax=Treponema berlinense TaxID=225004 RepID=UPI0026ECDF14|nr:helix-turn-helix domain-containing protein [Treponema berlinense]
MSFRENLRDELNYKDVRIKELSEKTKISIGTLNHYLAEKSTDPTAENAVKIARALGVTVEYLVTGKNPSTQNSKPQLTDEEIRIYKQNASLIKKLAQLSPASKKAIENLIEQMK